MPAHLTRRFVRAGARRTAATALALAGSVLFAGASLALAPQSQAAAAPHDSIGGVSAVTAIPSGLRFTGWAADPDSLASNVSVAAILDGRRIGVWTPTSLANPAVRAKYHTGATPGFALNAAVPSGSHTVCIAAGDLGPGSTTLIRCVATPLGTALSPTQLAARSPRGAFTGAWAHPASLHLHGWVDDPDYLWRHTVVVLYVDNRSVATVLTTTNPAPAAGAGANSLFDIWAPVASGSHVACLWAVNTGFGSNTYLGCRALDTRGPAGTAPVAQPALNKAVIAEAKRHIGQPYVWGAAGPSAFDCSGLVYYSYRKYGHTLPRISEDQFRAARLIPASRAVAGDLVFYSDTEGDVHHVGIVSSPGMSVAAIDEAEGVDWQRIWPNATTYYGSFTHT